MVSADGMHPSVGQSLDGLSFSLWELRRGVELVDIVLPEGLQSFSSLSVFPLILPLGSLGSV